MAGQGSISDGESRCKLYVGDGMDSKCVEAVGSKHFRFAKGSAPLGKCLLY